MQLIAHEAHDEGKIHQEEDRRKDLISSYRRDTAGL